MLKREKIVFIFLCLIMWGVNGYLSINRGSASIDSFIGGGFGGSLISIPIWSCIGVILGNVGLFFYNIIKPSKKESLSIWQKANLGLIAGIMLKPMLNIVW